MVVRDRLQDFIGKGQYDNLDHQDGGVDVNGSHKCELIDILESTDLHIVLFKVHEVLKLVDDFEYHVCELEVMNNQLTKQQRRGVNLPSELLELRKAIDDKSKTIRELLMNDVTQQPLRMLPGMDLNPCIEIRNHHLQLLLNRFAEVRLQHQNAQVRFEEMVDECNDSDGLYDDISICSQLSESDWVLITNHAKDTFQDDDLREKEIYNLEHSIAELNALFTEMKGLVEAEEYKLNIIEVKTHCAEVAVTKAASRLSRVRALKKRLKRKKAWMCLSASLSFAGTVLVILCVI